MFCLVTFCPIKSYLFYLQELLNKGLNSSGWIQDSLCSIIFVVGATFLMMPCVLLGSNGTDGTYFLDCRNHIRVFVCWAGLGWAGLAGLGWARWSEVPNVAETFYLHSDTELGPPSPTEPASHHHICVNFNICLDFNKTCKTTDVSNNHFAAVLLSTFYFRN